VVAVVVAVGAGVAVAVGVAVGVVVAVGVGVAVMPVIYDMPFAEYLEAPGASKHRLQDLVDKSPRAMRESVSVPSAAMQLGTLVHQLVLEPDKPVVARPDHANRSSNAGKEAWVDWLHSLNMDLDEPEIPETATTPGKILDVRLTALMGQLEQRGALVTTQDSLDKAQRIRDAVWDAEVLVADETYTGSELFSEGHAEVSLFHQDPETGVLCKGRLDWLPDKRGILIDLKTAQDASYESFARDAAKYGYHLQDALYGRLASWALGGPIRPMLFVVAQTEPPYEVAFYELDGVARTAGWQKIRHALDIWRRCERTGQWPGIGWDWDRKAYTIQTLSLPKWAL